VPGGQDLSQFATQPGGGSTSTLAGLAPQPQPRQNPLEALARQNPDAALLVQKQQQQQQEFALKRQEQQLTWGLKSIEAVAQMSQGVTNQADLDRVRADMQQVAPQAAARLPQFYSKEAMEAYQQSALSVKERQELKIADVQAQADAVKAQADLVKARQQGVTDAIKLGEVEYKETPQGWIAVPKYPGASGTPGVGGTPVTVGGQQAQGMQGQSQAQAQTQQTRQGEMALMQHYDTLAKPYREVRDAMGRIEAAGSSPTPAGDMALVYAYMKMLDPSTGIRNEEIKNAEMIGGLPGQATRWLAWLQGDKPLPDGVRKDFLDRSKKLYSQYMKDYEDVGGQYRTLAQRQGYNPDNVVLEYRSTTPAGGRPGQGQPTGQGPTGTSGQGPATFDTADFTKWRQGAGKTGNPTAADVQAYFEAKGLKRR